MAKMWRRRMGGMILCSMACTTVMLAVQGRIREAIPLHLCSVSALAAAVLAAVAFGPQLEAVLGSFVLYFAAPFAAVAAFGGCLYLWNRAISNQDKQLDAFLLGYFSKEQVKQYIQVTEKMHAEGGSEKSRVFTEHYRDDRLKALDTNKH